MNLKPKIRTINKRKIYSSTEEVLKTDIGNRIFKILMKNHRTNTKPSLFDFISKDIEDYSINNLKWIFEFLTENSDLQKKYNRLLKVFAKKETDEGVIVDETILKQFDEILGIPAIKKHLGEKKLHRLQERILNSRLKHHPDEMKITGDKGPDGKKTIFGELENLNGVEIPFWFSEKTNRYHNLEISGEEILSLKDIIKHVDITDKKLYKSEKYNNGQVLSGIFRNQENYWLPFQLEGDKYIAIKSIENHVIKTIGSCTRDDNGKFLYGEFEEDNGEIKEINGKQKNIRGSRQTFWIEQNQYKLLKIEDEEIKDVKNIEREIKKVEIIKKDKDNKEQRGFITDDKNNGKVLHGDFKNRKNVWLPFRLEGDKYISLKIEGVEILKVNKIKRNDNGKVISGEFYNSDGIRQNFQIAGGKYVKNNGLIRRIKSYLVRKNKTGHSK